MRVLKLIKMKYFAFLKNKKRVQSLNSAPSKNFLSELKLSATAAVFVTTIAAGAALAVKDIGV